MRKSQYRYTTERLCLLQVMISDYYEKSVRSQEVEYSSGVTPCSRRNVATSGSW